MKIQYYTYQQAAAIAADHQHLVGQPFEPGQPEAAALIAAVLVVPYSRILQWRHVYAHLTGTHMPPVAAASPNGRFDVLLLPNEPLDPDRPFRTKCLRSYLLEQNLPFKPTAYKQQAANPKM